MHERSQSKADRIHGHQPDITASASHTTTQRGPSPQSTAQHHGTSDHGTTTTLHRTAFWSAARNCLRMPQRRVQSCVSGGLHIRTNPSSVQNARIYANPSHNKHHRLGLWSATTTQFLPDVVSAGDAKFLSHSGLATVQSTGLVELLLRVEFFEPVTNHNSKSTRTHTHTPAVDS